ncbi:hypothetical protein, partial [Pediococcus acidilactici]|uniref:hypothetical protein n=1 Tax=Pediococcus acidilactici TaxID=1254 RepID=UPI00300DAE86
LDVSVDLMAGLVRQPGEYRKRKVGWRFMDGKHLRTFFLDSRGAPQARVSVYYRPIAALRGAAANGQKLPLNKTR